MNPQSVILGIVQGITEFLPVSSSGHLILIPEIFNWNDQGMAFDVVVHLGTLVAIIFAFRQKIAKMLKAIIGQGRGQEKQSRLSGLIILSIIPAALAGYLFNDYIEANFRSKTVVVVSLIFWAIVLWLADRRFTHTRRHTKTSSSVTIPQTITVALSQAIALIPGTSRSGITMSAGLFSKMDRSTAVEFSFLISIPIIALAGLWELFILFKTGFNGVEIGGLITGFIASALSGFVAIKFLLSFVKRWGFGLFVFYRIALGALILILL
ncbi:undecaprenyl-diphosphate phosphatase [Candidatus Falkowbacteria bacterium]|nr:undecaprenyl-diphosphate phosphatase [Candidatus Falkowbacteria bacterium]